MGFVNIFLITAFVSLLTTSRGSDPVTCGSLIKLTHIESKFQLHSHEIAFGSGSKQQSVTAIESHDDNGNYWIVKEALGESEPCHTGEPIQCDTVIRLEHQATGRNLHTHRVASPLSNQQEVSCFDKEEMGDLNDNWILKCTDNQQEGIWYQNSPVRFVSETTRAFLHSHSQHRFTQRNCPNCPIIGQQEVTGFSEANYQNAWKVTDGAFFSRN